MITGKIRARIEHCCAKQSVLAAFIGVHSEGDAPLRRPPATRLCASLVAGDLVVVGDGGGYVRRIDLFKEHAGAAFL